MRLEARILAAAAIGLMLTACDGAPTTPPGLRPAESLPRPPVAGAEVELTPSVLETNEQVVAREATRLNIKPDSQEKQRWSAFKVSSPPIKPSLPNFEPVLTARILGVHEAMGNSKNKYFIDAKEFIDRNDKIKFRVEIVYPLLNKRNEPITSQTITWVTEEKDRQLFHSMQLNAEQVVNSQELNGINLAFQMIRFVARVQHLSSLFNPSYSLSTQFTPEVMDRTEAYSIAVQVQAYIVAYGQGYRGGVGSELEQDATAFIHFGSNPQGSSWIEYVKNRAANNQNNRAATRL